MDNNVIDIRINDYGTLEVVTIPVKLYKDSYKVVKLRVKAPKNDTAILKVYGSDRDDAGEQVWTSSAYTLPYKENIVIGNKEYTVYEDYIPEEFCQKNGELYLTFSQGLMDLEKWVSIITSGTLNLYVSGEGFNYAGVEIPESDKLAYKINKTFENYEKIVVDVDNTKQDVEDAKANSEEALSKAEEALAQVTETTGTQVFVDGVKVNTFNANTKADLSVVNELQQNVNDINSDIDAINNTQSQFENKQEQLEQSQNQLSNTQSQFSNPNLIINGDFRVNQRGLSSYVAGGSATKVYCVDRFYLTWATELTSINDDSISLKFVRQYGSFGQVFEDYNRFKGKTVTFSVKAKNPSRTNCLWLNISDGVQELTTLITGDGIFTKTITVSENATKLQCIIFNTASTGTEVTLDVNYMKLEIGSVATPNNPRPYAEELALCQRYYLKFIQSTASITNPAFIGSFFATSATGGFSLIDLPNSIRSGFTVKTANLGYKIGSSDTVNFTAVSYAMITSNFTKLKLYCGGGSGLTAGSVYPLCIYGDDLMLELDSEL